MIHKCSLQDINTKEKLPRLRPNANLAEKLARRMQCFITVDLNIKKCKEFFSDLRSPMRIEMRRHFNSPYFYVIHPFSRMNWFLEFLFIIVWFWRYLTVPIFHSITYRIYNSFIKYPTYLVDISQMLLLISSFFTGYTVRNIRKIIIEPKEIAKRYLTTYFCFDVVAIFHSFLINSSYEGISMPVRISHDIICALALVAYLVRFKTFLSNLKNILFSSVNKSFSIVILQAFLVAFVIHIYTCLIYLISWWYHEGEVPEGSLVQIVQKRSSSTFSLYIECFLLVICHFLGAEYSGGDLRVPFEQFCLFVMSFTGRLYTLFLMANLLQVFGYPGNSEAEYERYLGQLNALMRCKNLPPDLQKKLVNYYECKFMKNHFNEDTIFSDLDDFMRTELLLFNARKLLQKIEAFRLIPRTQFSQLFMYKESTIFLVNDIISRRGDKIEKIYFICYGTVAVLNKVDQEIAHLEDGDHFGLISYWTSNTSQHIFSHIAIETCEILAISTKTLDEFFARNPDALRYFENKVREKIESYKRAARNINRGGVGLLAELRSNVLFEYPKKRHSFVE